LQTDFRTKNGSRFWDQNRSAIFIFQSFSDFCFRIAIMFAIENLIRINHGPGFISKSNPDHFVSIAFWFFLIVFKA